MRIDFLVHVDANQNGIVNNFLNKITTDTTIYEFKDIPVFPHTVTSGTNGDLRTVTGSLTFLTDADAVQVFAELSSLANSPQVNNKIIYVELLLLENTHHFPNPLPDVIISTSTVGDPTDLIAYGYHDLQN